MDQQLAVFVAVVEKGNFSRAAEELHMTQPAISQYIQALERHVGTKLLERSNKYVRLNSAGEIVYHHAKEILGLYTRMQGLVDDHLHTAAGPLAIGASYTFGEYVLPHIVSYVRQDYPLIKPTITIGNTKEIAELVMNHQLDLGIVEGEFRHEKLHIEPFADDRMVVLVSSKHPLANQSEVTVSEISQETWIVREPGSGTREATERMFQEFGFQPGDLMEFGSTQIIKESVEAGLGISLLSQWTVRKELLLGTVYVLPITGFPVTRKFSIVTPSTLFHTKALEVFIETLRKHTSRGGIQDAMDTRGLPGINEEF